MLIGIYVCHYVYVYLYHAYSSSDAYNSTYFSEVLCVFDLWIRLEGLKDCFIDDGLELFSIGLSS